MPNSRSVLLSYAILGLFPLTRLLCSFRFNEGQKFCVGGAGFFSEAPTRHTAMTRGLACEAAGQNSAPRLQSTSRLMCVALTSVNPTSRLHPLHPGCPPGMGMGPPAFWRGAGTSCKRGFPPRRGAGRSQGRPGFGEIVAANRSIDQFALTLGSRTQGHVYASPTMTLSNPRLCVPASSQGVAN